MMHGLGRLNGVRSSATSLFLIFLFNKSDVLVWRDRNGDYKNFSVGNAWKDIRPRDVEVAWARMVWFAYCIPRHAFLLWLIMKRKLKTQDLWKHWDTQGSNSYLLVTIRSPLLWSIVDGLLVIANSRALHGFVAKLASSYFIWQEWNARLFTQKQRTEDQVIDIIVATVRLKLVLYRFRKSRRQDFG
ncbi:lupus La protein [Tanacetum coccineum]